MLSDGLWDKTEKRKAIHRRGTEGTEKTFFKLLTTPAAQLTIETSVPLW
jgi:hypothetical protein